MENPLKIISDNSTHKLIEGFDMIDVGGISGILYKFGLVLLGFLSPITNMLLGLIVICHLNLFVTLVRVKRKRREFSSFLSKIIIYMATIMMVHFINSFILFGSSDLIPMESFVAAILCLSELKEILKGINKIKYTPGITKIIEKLSHKK